MSLLHSILLSRASCRMIRGKTIPLVILLILAFVAVSYIAVLAFPSHVNTRTKAKVFRYELRDALPDGVMEEHIDSKISCRFHTCFEINNCSITLGDQIGVYVYPEAEFVTADDTDEKIASSVTIEYRELIAAVKSSRYYQENASLACVFIPSIDTLSQDLVNVDVVSLMLHTLPE